MKKKIGDLTLLSTLVVTTSGRGFKDRASALSFYKISKREVPFVEGTYFLEQTCSLISYSFIFFFNRPFYADTYRTFYTSLLIFQALFFLFLQHVFIPIFFRCRQPHYNFIIQRYGFKVSTPIVYNNVYETKQRYLKLYQNRRVQKF